MKKIKIFSFAFALLLALPLFAACTTQIPSRTIYTGKEKSYNINYYQAFLNNTIETENNNVVNNSVYNADNNNDGVYLRIGMHYIGSEQFDAQLAILNNYSEYNFATSLPNNTYWSSCEYFDGYFYLLGENGAPYKITKAGDYNLLSSFELPIESGQLNKNGLNINLNLNITIQTVSNSTTLQIIGSECDCITINQLKNVFSNISYIDQLNN